MGIEPYLISSGGVGSCALGEYFGEQNINAKNTVSAHEKDPRIPVRGARVLYVFGHPYNQLLSFYRRGFLNKPFFHCLHVRGQYWEMAKKDSWTLGEYLENGVDFFDIRGHFNEWMNYNNREYEILFMRYCYIPQHIQRVVEWLELSPGKDFVFKPRDSNWLVESDVIRDGLQKMYGEFAELIESLPDLFTMQGNKPCML